METLTKEQVAHFCYWVTEHHDHRGAKNYNGFNRILFIEQVLIPQFLKKYRSGILTGWKKS